MRYYPIARNWSRKIAPHLGDREANRLLLRDFNKFTYRRWHQRFEPGMLPHQFESCDWWCRHRGRMPRFWLYVKHSACHWLVNFNRRLASLAEPERQWRIVSSPEHDGLGRRRGALRHELSRLGRSRRGSLRVGFTRRRNLSDRQEFGALSGRAFQPLHTPLLAWVRGRAERLAEKDGVLGA